MTALGGIAYEYWTVRQAINYLRTDWLLGWACVSDSDTVQKESKAPPPVHDIQDSPPFLLVHPTSLSNACLGLSLAASMRVSACSAK